MIYLRRETFTGIKVSYSAASRLDRGQNHKEIMGYQTCSCDWRCCMFATYIESYTTRSWIRRSTIVRAFVDRFIPSVCYACPPAHRTIATLLLRVNPRLSSSDVSSYGFDVRSYRSAICSEDTSPSRIQNSSDDDTPMATSTSSGHLMLRSHTINAVQGQMRSFGWIR